MCVCEWGGGRIQLLYSVKVFIITLSEQEGKGIGTH